ncbi:hypothetical protein [Arthrospira platensis]|jgi:hypothetical protein|uniref:Uncharacterized protein n=1 Tax=Limnospira platensis NIES-46 TaxID=1236695 RepID=A0A5M3TAZ4_LIMPL|nr:hypothetical protein [Arthrospira platensis]AMW29343.1 hypothetical protein AP285_16690 [Arthrospira platensis YZ]KDR58433.1 hypothetical protein APPUASWS_005000 [Arthrospira platensis str. Paraca]MBD2671685.1 hypothetical protein [Arthrospira platensis FACHB-439]MBD2712681.1 hypothetical protein [Arthrospira platensis FACHB-835]MDF2213273.1 hypothetical protein [Arthrospira platensis NCB002]MDT9297532.1 hypothetical protein [Arthrospira platensis PCC 7345]MDT9313000.1 hypothetical protei
MKLPFNFGVLTAGFVVILLLTFSILQWLNIPSGSFLDWIIGGITFGWLLLIVTVPWNIHFEAKEVLAEAAESDKKGIPIEPSQRSYVHKLVGRSLWAAIALHIASAIVLLWLSWAGISVVGYIGSVAALLLTILRPCLRGYQYLVARLSMVRREFSYPREDVVELRGRVEFIEASLEQIQKSLDPNKSNSWASKQNEKLSFCQNEITRLAADMQTLKATNKSEHERLSRTAEKAIAQITEDSQILNNVREIIRFFKEA